MLETPSGALLIDCGLAPVELAARFAAIGVNWSAVRAVVITHTHTDHWNRYTLEHLRRVSVPFFAHPRHHEALASIAAHQLLERAGLLREYTAEQKFEPFSGLTCSAVSVPHDSDPTFAIRCDASDRPNGLTWSLGLASDLGRVPDALLTAFAGVDLLAIEFNHDERMERRSRRPRFLIQRVLSDLGHLSNWQAGEAVRAFAEAAGEGHLRAVVQLHLSRDCNTPELALQAGQQAVRLRSPGTQVVAANQHHPIEPIPLLLRPARAARVPKLSAPPPRSLQPSLPGFDDPAAEE